MSGFATEWLDLREPADHAARDRSLLHAAVATICAAGDRPMVVDLGSGTGSTVRALAPGLAAPVRWRLVDHDETLLAEAGRRFPEAGIHRVDLRDLETLPLGGAALVTASALFDLVSESWVERFARTLSRNRTGLYAALSYDGAVDFKEEHEADRRVRDAFNHHQRGDKGFGPALGPDASDALERAFNAVGFTVERAWSPWRLASGALQDRFVEGLATAAGETGRIPAAEIRDWLGFRRASSGGCTVGHVDLLARPV